MEDIKKYVFKCNNLECENRIHLSIDNILRLKQIRVEFVCGSCRKIQTKIITEVL